MPQQWQPCAALSGSSRTACQCANDWWPLCSLCPWSPQWHLSLCTAQTLGSQVLVALDFSGTPLISQSQCFHSSASPSGAFWSRGSRHIWVWAMMQMTWEYFFTLLKFFSRCFSLSSSCHFLQHLVKACKNYASSSQIYASSYRSTSCTIPGCAQQRWSWRSGGLKEFPHSPQCLQPPWVASSQWPSFYFPLVHLGSWPTDFPHNIGHASLVNQECHKVDWLGKGHPWRSSSPSHDACCHASQAGSPVTHVWEQRTSCEACCHQIPPVEQEFLIDWVDPPFPEMHFKISTKYLKQNASIIFVTVCLK